jgi:hypothetical protein
MIDAIAETSASAAVLDHQQQKADSPSDADTARCLASPADALQEGTYITFIVRLGYSIRRWVTFIVRIAAP